MGKVPEAKSLIANTNALAQFDQSDKPVSYAWKQQPNVKPEVGATDRNATGIVTVTYPDGTTQDVEVNVLVDKSDADTYTPNGQEVKHQSVVHQTQQQVSPTWVNYQQARQLLGKNQSIRRHQAIKKARW